MVSLSSINQKLDPVCQKQYVLPIGDYQKIPKIDTKNPVSCYTRTKYHNSSKEKLKIKVEKSYEKRLKIEENKLGSKIKYKVNKKLLNNDDLLKYKDKANDFIIPGTGQPSENCNEWIPIKFCSECGHLIFTKGNCNSPKCPIHSTKWRYKRTATIFKRIYSHKLTFNTRSGHIVVSISNDDKAKLKTFDGFKKVTRSVVRFLKKKGVLGGAVIYHPFRIIPEYKRQIYDIFNENKDTGLGEFALWKTLSKKVKNWKDFVYYSPHFHIIGNYNFLQEGNKEDRYFFKRIGDFMPIGGATAQEGIIKCSMYQLSHVGIPKQWKKQSVIWFGSLAYNKWCIDKASQKVQDVTYYWQKKLLNNFAETEGETYNKCPECDGSLRPLWDLPNHIWKFKGFTRSLLQYSYGRAKGNKPPPIFKKHSLQTVQTHNIGVVKKAKEKAQVEKVPDLEGFDDISDSL